MTNEDVIYKVCEFLSEYGSMKQKWILVFLNAASKKEKNPFAVSRDKATKELEKVTKHFKNKEFTLID